MSFLTSWCTAAIHPDHCPEFQLQHCFEESMGGNTFLIFIRVEHYLIETLEPWPGLDSAIKLLPQSWHPRFLFGLETREDMLHIAANVVDKHLTSLSSRGEVRYTIQKEEKRKGDWLHKTYWYAATLKSEVLSGASGDIFVCCLC